MLLGAGEWWLSMALSDEIARQVGSKGVGMLYPNAIDHGLDRKLPTSFHDLLLAAVRHAGGAVVDESVPVLRGIPSTDLDALTEMLVTCLPGRFRLTGALDRRLLVAERHPEFGDWTLADLSGRPHETRAWPDWCRDRLTVRDPRQWLSVGSLTDEALYRLMRPRLLLVALYHPEWFPLPRFPLAISDLARAARLTLQGEVCLMDMQLGVSLDDVLESIEGWKPDVVGVSATFGQYDLMTRLLDRLYALQDAIPLVLAGGSLTVRNERLLLDRYPRLLVARGSGEPTIADAVSYFHGDLELHDMRGIGYSGGPGGGGLVIGGHHRTATTTNRAQVNFLPELDLLDATFDHGGVAQLEVSRGCTNYCSFCPRGHKGTWAGVDPTVLPWMFKAMRQVFDRHPAVSQTLYLVDEEFIGQDVDAVPRALALAEMLHAAGFRWESSCRVDQVVASGRDRDWHLERATMWRQLVAAGLRRMLFGVESGVTSVLTRFNKETTADQNALAVRTLSALGVPTRFTYITFDQLMDFAELRATHAFQARTDLLLRPLPHLAVEEIVDGVRDPDFVAANSVDLPFYTSISYLLVSMECLIGAAYTRQVQAAGLAGAVHPSMGRLDADFKDWRIGRCSYHAQLWIDRQFALDYTLKSLEKVLDGKPRRDIRSARVTIKDAAFALLTRMIDLAAKAPRSSRDVGRLDAEFRMAMNDELDRLASRMQTAVDAVVPKLPAEAGGILLREHRRWQNIQNWRLINAADPCGS